MRKNRRTFLAHQIKKHGFKIGAELGIRTGGTSIYLLEQCPDLKLYMVDNWTPGKRNTNWRKRPEAYEDVKTRFWEAWKQTSPEVAARGILLEMDTLEAAKTLDDGVLDFVFIDADHKRNSVKGDILAWTPKVRSGGLVSGHDYEPRFRGVRRAVDELYGNQAKMTGYDSVWYVWKS